MNLLDIETRRVAVISTAHMTSADDRLLTLTGPPEWPSPVHNSHDYGYAFTPLQEEDHKEWLSFGLSEELWHNLKLVFAAGYDRVELDADGPVVEGLKRFDW